MIDVKNFSDFENSLKGNVLNNYASIEDFQVYYDDIAKYIFGNVAVVISEGNNRTIYYLDEIEFYYNNLSQEKIDSAKGVKGKNITEEEKRYIYHFSCTYKRDKEANQLFWHYSGVDICFQSFMDRNCYGGILIRSLTKEYIDNKGEVVRELIAGPLRCSNELMNQSILLNCVPHIEEIKWPNYRIVNVNSIGSTIRQGIETKYKDVLESIYNEKDRKNYKFPFFCYFIKKEENEWKSAKYGSIPEKRANYIRSIV